jgi:hypothetical protein
MNRLLLYLLFAGLCVAGFTSVDRPETVNAIIGDISFTSKYGTAPSGNMPDDTRIRTHLEYVEQLLRKKEASHLPSKLQQNRKKLLALLNEYHRSGSFPKNYDHPGRRPCFIDKEGNICAVGYLVAKTAGLDVAQKINAEHQYDYIEDMKTPELANWIAASGLTLEECAMIQPTYGWRDPKEETPAGYTISTSLLSGANAVFTGVNIRQSIAGKKSATVTLIGLASGITQTTLGILDMENNNSNNQSRNTMGQLNIGLGVATIATSVVNLVLNKQPRTRKTDIALGSFRAGNNDQALGLTLTRKL